MKKLSLLLILLASVLPLTAQTAVEFLGMPLRGNTKSAFAEKLISKGYTYKGEMDGYVMYDGQFLGLDADVTLVPSKEPDGIQAVGIMAKQINPVKLGQVFVELMQRYMQKYGDYQYSTKQQADGGMVVSFKKAMPDGKTDTINMESKFAGQSCSLTIFYAVGIKDEAEEASAGPTGIGADDI